MAEPGQDGAMAVLRGEVRRVVIVERFQNLADLACDLGRAAAALAIEQGGDARAFGQAFDLGPPAADRAGRDAGFRRSGAGGLGARNADGDQRLGTLRTAASRARACSFCASVACSHALKSARTSPVSGSW